MIGFYIRYNNLITNIISFCKFLQYVYQSIYTKIFVFVEKENFEMVVCITETSS